MKDEKLQRSIEFDSAPFVLTMEQAPSNSGPGEPLKAGYPCPKCQSGQLDYDGCLNLACPNCGYAVGGCFT